MNFFDVQLPFFKPLWRRVLVTAFCLGWGLFELSNGEVFWAVLYLAAGTYCAHQFFYAFAPKDDDKKE